MRRRKRIWRKSVPKAMRCALKRAAKRQLGLTRRQLGAIGAGHMEAPEGYTELLRLGLRYLQTFDPYREEKKKTKVKRVARRLLNSP